jgi:hypothetical protein
MNAVLSLLWLKLIWLTGISFGSIYFSCWINANMTSTNEVTTIATTVTTTRIKWTDITTIPLQLHTFTDEQHQLLEDAYNRATGIARSYTTPNGWIHHQPTPFVTPCAMCHAAWWHITYPYQHHHSSQSSRHHHHERKSNTNSNDDEARSKMIPPYTSCNIIRLFQPFGLDGYTFDEKKKCYIRPFEIDDDNKKQISNELWMVCLQPETTIDIVEALVKKGANVNVSHGRDAHHNFISRFGKKRFMSLSLLFSVSPQTMYFHVHTNRWSKCVRELCSVSK